MGFIINKEKTDGRMAEVSRDFIAYIALLYYKDGLMQTEIAERTNVSRASVVNYLKMARDHGIVDVRIEGASFASSNDAKRMKEKYSLTDAYIVDIDAASEPSRDLFERQIGRVGAMALYDLVGEHSKIGVGWGQTIWHLSNEIPRGHMPSVEVSQAFGAAPAKVPFNSAACASKIAARLNAGFTPLNVPAIVSTQELATSLRAEPGIGQEIRDLNKSEIMVFSVADAQAGQNAINAGIFTRTEVQKLVEEGAVGSVLGRYYDRSGAQVAGVPDDRLFGMRLEELLATPVRVLVAGGEQKREAIEGALVGGFATHLVIDRDLSASLLG